MHQSKTSCSLIQNVHDPLLSYKSMLVVMNSKRSTRPADASNASVDWPWNVQSSRLA